MLSSILAFPDQLAEGWATARSTSWLPPAIDSLTEVVVLGLGGSAFGGEVIRNLLYATSPLPYLIYRGYDVPAHIGSKSLVLVSSYSGNTEETITAAQLAFDKGAQLGVICSGGLLRDWALEQGLPVFRLPTGYSPRAACAFSITHQLEIVHRMGLMPDYSYSLQLAIDRLSRFSGQSLLRELAQHLSGKWVALYAEDRIESAAIRLRQQINENAKQLCHHHVIPEMNHNELVGWPLPDQLERLFLALRHPNEHPRNRLRFDFMANEARVLGHTWLELHSEAKDPLGVLLDLIHSGDWLSIFLAEINGVDPSPVAVIDRLKSSLAQFA
jgi:glucose/mannose-6-phosphate isomerase